MSLSKYLLTAVKEFIEVVSILQCPVLEWIYPCTLLWLHTSNTTRATECSSFSSGLQSSVRGVQDGITEWWVFLASSLLLRLISKPPSTVWVRRVKSETEVFTLILSLLSSPYDTPRLWKVIHKANTCVKMYKELLLSFPYLRQRSLSQDQGLCVPKILSVWAQISLPEGGYCTIRQQQPDYIAVYWYKVLQLRSKCYVWKTHGFILSV